MLGRLLASIAGDPLDRAARRYARDLPRQLVRDYGAAARYSPDQIRLSVGRAKLPPEHLAIGYAAYLDHAAFTAVLPGRADEYEALRGLFVKHEDVGLQSEKSGAHDE